MPAALVGAATPGAASAMHVEATHAFLTLQQARDTVPEVIPGYETTLRYLRSLEPRPSAREEELNGDLNLGLVVNETQSPTGQEFFDVFYSVWEAPEGVRSFTIRIQEQPIQGLFTRVVIVLDDEPLIQIPLQPRSAFIEDVGRQAAIYVRDRLSERPTRPGANG